MFRHGIPLTGVPSAFCHLRSFCCTIKICPGELPATRGVLIMSWQFISEIFDFAVQGLGIVFLSLATLSILLAELREE